VKTLGTPFRLYSPEGVPVVSKSKLYSFPLNLAEYATFTTYYAQTEKAVCEIINVL
jgi:hypothetical protein